MTVGHLVITVVAPIFAFVNVCALFVAHLIATVAQARITVRCSFELALGMISADPRVLLARVDRLTFPAAVPLVPLVAFAVEGAGCVDAHSVVSAQLFLRETFIDVFADDLRWVLLFWIHFRKAATTTA